MVATTPGISWVSPPLVLLVSLLIAAVIVSPVSGDFRQGPSSDTSAGVMDWSVETTDDGVVLSGSLSDPADIGELGVWIISDTIRRYESIQVQDPDHLSSPLPPEVSENLMSEPVYLFIQHPGADGLMQVYPNNPLVTSAMLYADKTEGKRGLTLVSLKGPEAADTGEIAETLEEIITDPSSIGMDDVWVVFSSDPGASGSASTSELTDEEDGAEDIARDPAGTGSLSEDPDEDEAEPVVSGAETSSADELNMKGENLGELGKYGEALPYFEEATKADSKHLKAWINLGTCLNNGFRRYEEAVLAFDKALSIDPRNSLAWENKGNALYNLKRYEEAVKAYENALAFDPTSTDALNNKNRALKKLGRF